MPPETCGVDLQRNKTSLHIVTSVGYSIEPFYLLAVVQRVNVAYDHTRGHNRMRVRPVIERSISQHTKLTSDKTSMHAAEFEPAIPAIQRSQTHVCRMHGQRDRPGNIPGLENAQLKVTVHLTLCIMYGFVAVTQKYETPA